MERDIVYYSSGGNSDVGATRSSRSGEVEKKCDELEKDLDMIWEILSQKRRRGNGGEGAVKESERCSCIKFNSGRTAHAKCLYFFSNDAGTPTSGPSKEPLGVG